MHSCVHVRVCGSPGRVTARGGGTRPTLFEGRDGVVAWLYTSALASMAGHSTLEPERRLYHQDTASRAIVHTPDIVFIGLKAAAHGAIREDHAARVRGKTGGRCRRPIDGLYIAEWMAKGQSRIGLAEVHQADQLLDLREPVASAQRRTKVNGGLPLERDAIRHLLPDQARRVIADFRPVRGDDEPDTCRGRATGRRTAGRQAGECEKHLVKFRRQRGAGRQGVDCEKHLVKLRRQRGAGRQGVDREKHLVKFHRQSQVAARQLKMFLIMFLRPTMAGAMPFVMLLRPFIVVARYPVRWLARMVLVRPSLGVDVAIHR